MDDGTYGEFDYFTEGVPLRMLTAGTLAQLAPFINSYDHTLLEIFRLESNHRRQFNVEPLALMLLTTAYFDARTRAENALVNIPVTLEEHHIRFDNAHRQWQEEVGHTIDFFTPQFQVWFSPSALRARWVRIVRIISLYHALATVDSIRRGIPLPIRYRPLGYSITAATGISQDEGMILRQIHSLDPRLVPEHPNMTPATPTPLAPARAINLLLPSLDFYDENQQPTVIGLPAVQLPLAPGHNDFLHFEAANSIYDAEQFAASGEALVESDDVEGFRLGRRRDEHQADGQASGAGSSSMGLTAGVRAPPTIPPPAGAAAAAPATTPATAPASKWPAGHWGTSAPRNEPFATWGSTEPEPWGSLPQPVNWGTSGNNTDASNARWGNPSRDPLPPPPQFAQSRRSVNNPHHRPRAPLPGPRLRNSQTPGYDSSRRDQDPRSSSSRPHDDSYRRESDDSRSRRRERSLSPPRTSRRRSRSPSRHEVASLTPASSNPGYGAALAPYGSGAWGTASWGMPSFGMAMPFAMPGPRVVPGSQMLGMGEDGGLVPIVRIGMPGFVGQMGPPPPPAPFPSDAVPSSSRRGRQRSRSPSRSRSRSPPRHNQRRDDSPDRDYNYRGYGSGRGQGRWKH